MSIGPTHDVVLSGIILALAIFGLVSRRDGIGVVASLALFLLAPVVAFAGLAEAGAANQLPAQGEVVALVMVGAAAAVALLGAAGVALLRRHNGVLDVDASTELDA
ncbi:MAG: NADH-quinone oxidoreductase subunit K [Candidatus Dormibacteria bacterium]